MAGLARAERALEVGCGTGAALIDLADAPARIHGVDIDLSALSACRKNAPFACLTGGDAQALPFAAGVFDLVFCHYLLLWVRSPIDALREMKRVAKPGGSVLACAEPDHTARVDQPRELEVLGRLQTFALRQQGANPGVGAQLSSAFKEAGLTIVEAGAIQNSGALWTLPELESEWSVIQSDLAGIAAGPELARLRRIDQEAWALGTRVLQVPTYYAWGRA